MQKLLLLKEIYFEAFKNWPFDILRKYFKVYSWFCFALIVIGLYAIIYRAATGFAFD